MKTYRVLSTKHLNESHRGRLIQANISLVHANFIETKPLPFSLPSEYQHWIFTSQNAVRAVFSSPEKSKCDKKNIYCVGEKTKTLLEENGQKVIKMSKKSADLGHFLAKHYKNERFLFCCGNRKMEDLPTILSDNNIPLREVEVYQTQLLPKKIEGQFDGVLFFSPSAVESFLKKNTLKQAQCICIGSSTAKALESYTTHISVASSPTTEHVILKTIQHFGKYEYVKK
jgi:uroporphyrinogen-III synthase